MENQLYFLPSLSALAITDQATGATSFTRVDTTCLKWSHRQDMLLREILNSGADIIALEEVDHFHDFFQPALSSADGFTGQFLTKPNSPCLESKPNNDPDAVLQVFCFQATGQERAEIGQTRD